MRAIDTNVLVRLIARDDARQAEAAEQFVAKGAWVSQLVLAECVWVLEAIHGLDSRQLADVVEMLLTHRDLTLQDADAVSLALLAFRRRPSLGFSGCLIVEIARKAGHLPLGTFDRGLGGVEGAERIGRP